MKCIVCKKEAELNADGSCDDCAATNYSSKTLILEVDFVSPASKELHGAKYIMRVQGAKSFDYICANDIEIADLFNRVYEALHSGKGSAC